MKKLILSLLFIPLFGISSTALAQKEEGTVIGTVSGPADNASGALISIDKEVHDYGTIEQGADGTSVFVITNNGTAPLIISLCKGSCGCTVPQCPKEPIPPGGTAEIKVKYDTKRVGPINKSVTITSNADNEPRKVIRISGTVKAKPQGGAPTNTGSGMPINK